VIAGRRNSRNEGLKIQPGKPATLIQAQTHCKMIYFFSHHLLLGYTHIILRACSLHQSALQPPQCKIWLVLHPVRGISFQYLIPWQLRSVTVYWLQWFRAGAASPLIYKAAFFASLLCDLVLQI